MSGLIESATSILSTSEKRVDIIARNVANISTPGFKRRIGFQKFIAAAQNNLDQRAEPQVAIRREFLQGTITPTDNPLDIAISGEGFFQLRADDAMIYSRQGQFTRATNGAVVNAQGHVLQQAGGGDLIIDSGAVSILEDGTVLNNGVPIARLEAVAASNPSAIKPFGDTAFAITGDATDVVPNAVFRQGMIENSNVVIGDEMVAMMVALRQSEGGARLVQVYDDLLGRALTTLGQSGR